MTLLSLARRWQSSFAATTTRQSVAGTDDNVASPRQAFPPPYSFHSERVLSAVLRDSVVTLFGGVLLASPFALPFLSSSHTRTLVARFHVSNTSTAGTLRLERYVRATQPLDMHSKRVCTDCPDSFGKAPSSPRSPTLPNRCAPTHPSGRLLGLVRCCPTLSGACGPAARTRLPHSQKSPNARRLAHAHYALQDAVSGTQRQAVCACERHSRDGGPQAGRVRSESATFQRTASRAPFTLRLPATCSGFADASPSSHSLRPSKGKGR